MSLKKGNIYILWGMYVPMLIFSIGLLYSNFVLLEILQNSDWHCLRLKFIDGMMLILIRWYDVTIYYFGVNSEIS